MFRTTARSLSRSIHSTPTALKTVTEKVAEVADTVNKKVGKGLASAIETGEKAAQSTKETLGSTTTTTKKKAGDASKVAGQAAREVKDEANK